ncbi:methyltransferase type 11 [Phlyctema vagabunda]|uniref:Methyltransferase type 11 n=1 Tax=Phlyctema vagabunda TaxID=108571 RepID=A0ABR4PJ73_9HELO
MSSASSFHNAHSNTYERMASRCTLTVAEKIISSITPPITAESYVLDNASGTGVVTGCIRAVQPKARIVAADLAPAVLEILNQKGFDDVQTEVLDVRDLKTLKDETFSHVITNFGMAQDPKDTGGPARAAREIWRVLKPGGVAAVTTWRGRNFTTAFEQTSLRIRPDSEPFSWGADPAWETDYFLMNALAQAGFGEKVSVREIQSAAEAPSLDELVDNMLLFKDMFFKDYNEEEKSMLPSILKDELRKLDKFSEKEGRAAVEMTAWMGMAWK